MFDDNAPPLVSMYDDMIIEEQRQMKAENALSSATQQIGGTAGGPSNAITRRPLFDKPKAIRVSNYSEQRWPDVLSILAQYGTILERFEELRKKENYDPIPVKVLVESEDEVVRSSRLLFTGEGWTKITFATRDTADRLIAESGNITVGGRSLVIEAWTPEIHGRPRQDGFIFTGRVNTAAENLHRAITTAVDEPIPSALPRRRANSQSIFDDPFATPRSSSVGTIEPEPAVSLSTPGGSKLSTKMKGAKLVTLQDGALNGIFKKEPTFFQKLMSRVWGEVGLYGTSEQVKSGGWRAWFIDLLFGKL